MFLIKKAVGILGWVLNILNKITGHINLFVALLIGKKYLLRLKIVSCVSAHKQYWYTLHTAQCTVHVIYQRLGNIRQLNSFIGIEHILPKICGLYVYQRCQCALWAQGWEMRILWNMYIYSRKSIVFIKKKTDCAKEASFI